MQVSTDQAKSCAHSFQTCCFDEEGGFSKDFDGWRQTKEIFAINLLGILYLGKRSVLPINEIVNQSINQSITSRNPGRCLEQSLKGQLRRRFASKHFKKFSFGATIYLTVNKLLKRDFCLLFTGQRSSFISRLSFPT